MRTAATTKQSATNSKTTEQVERKNRWKSKRERERNQARYRIRQRVVAEINEDEDALAEVVDETTLFSLRNKYVSLSYRPWGAESVMKYSEGDRPLRRTTRITRAPPILQLESAAVDPSDL